MLVNFSFAEEVCTFCKKYGCTVGDTACRVKAQDAERAAVDAATKSNTGPAEGEMGKEKSFTFLCDEEGRDCKRKNPIVTEGVDLLTKKPNTILMAPGQKPEEGTVKWVQKGQIKPFPDQEGNKARVVTKRVRIGKDPKTGKSTFIAVPGPWTTTVINGWATTVIPTTK